MYEQGAHKVYENGKRARGKIFGLGIKIVDSGKYPSLQ